MARPKLPPNIATKMDDHYIVELTQGVTALIDIDMWDNHLSKYRWCACLTRANTNSPAHWRMTTKHIYAHRLIMEIATNSILDSKQEVDHITHSELPIIDNRVSNLRLANHTQNMWNQRKRSNNKSGFKGVCWHRRAGKWHAYISVNGEKIHLGLFTNIEDAVRVYNEAALLHHREFANLN